MTFWLYAMLTLTCSITQIMCINGAPLPADCSTKQDLLVCEHSIPTSIPRTVTKVHIKALRYDAKIAIKNIDRAWDAVEELDIMVNPGRDGYKINDYTFSKLRYLKTLGIHGRSVNEFGKYAFDGLDNLNLLDLSWCINLLFEAVTSVLVSNNLPQLTALNLAGIQTANTDLSLKHINLDKHFFELISSRSITNLSLSGTNLLIQNININRALPLTYFDISNITFVLGNQYDRYTKLHSIFYNLRTINISNVQFGFLMPGEVLNEYISVCLDMQEFLFNNENVYANELNSNPFIMKNSTIDYTQCLHMQSTSVKTLHLRSNSLTYLDATMLLPENHIQEIDISDNNIEYISSNIFSDMPSLKTLLIANNNLHLMEHTAEFVKLLTHFAGLQEFNIAGNHLTFIPYHMFKMNSRIRRIDLSNNHLTTIDVKLSHLILLEHLSLRKNWLKTLPSQLYLTISQLIDSPSPERGGNASTLEIDIHDNELECSCKNKGFVEWVVNYNKQRKTILATCNIGGRVTEINREALEESDYSCIRSAVIITSVTVSGCIATVIVIVSVWAIRRARVKRRQDRRHTYLNAFRNSRLFHGDTEVKYVAFLAHSSEDVEIVSNTIHVELDNCLKRLADINRTLICIGDRQFKPGFSIIEQTMICLQESCIVIVIMSKSFCQSEWCQFEIREAYQQQKPIILIFIEKVDECLMSPILLNIFKHQARATLYLRDGQYVLEPSWQDTCDAILTLASHQHEFLA